MFEHSGASRSRSFRDLWQDYSLDILAFAQVAGVDVDVVRNMLDNKPVPLTLAQQVFACVSELLEQKYVVENFIVPCVNTTQELQDEIALFLQRVRYPPPWQKE